MKEVLCEEVARHCCQALGGRLHALVLTGSLARNEGTFVSDTRGVLLRGDAEFLLVLDDRSHASTAELATIHRQIRTAIRQRGLRADVTLAASSSRYLRKLPPSIFAYELRNCGETLAGPRGILSLIPRFSSGDIPREDAWRLLANRLVEQLDGAGDLLQPEPTISPGLHYRTVKLYLDMATSLLIFLGAYAPTYAARLQALAALCTSARQTPPLPFDLARFCEDVRACTRWKLEPTDVVCNLSFWERAIDYAHALWRWELAQLVSGDPLGCTDAMMRLRMRQQPTREKLRGWAHVARQASWPEPFSRWSRWARNALRTSPRYAVYAAATHLIFDLRRSPGEFADHPTRGQRWRDLAAMLPAAPYSRGDGADPRRNLAADLIFNYHHFVTNTRS
jgi:hypothetical protein